MDISIDLSLDIHIHGNPVYVTVGNQLKRCYTWKQTVFVTTHGIAAVSDLLSGRCLNNLYTPISA